MSKQDQTRGAAAESLTLFALASLSAAAAFAACLPGAVWGLVLAPLLGGAVVFVADRMRLGQDRWWPVPLFACLTAALGVLGDIAFLGGRLVLLFAPVLAAGGALLAGLLKRVGRRRCGLCRHRIGLRELLFSCPRCALAVCDRRCWDFERRRCRLCTENGVPLLPTSDQWWDRTFGPRAVYGRCLACLAPYGERDLRPCGSCRRPMCREDWDAANGECVRCGWVCSGLPDSLRHLRIRSGDGTEVTTAH